jgi:uncharacterized protein
MPLDAFPHVLPRACLERFGRDGSGPGLDFLRGIEARPYLAPMWDMDVRFREMDQVEGYTQILTLCSPPIEQLALGSVAGDLARLANDSMAELVAKHPDRFVGFAASLPMADVDMCIAEVDRTVRNLGALGVQVFTNVNGRPVDDPRYEPLWARLHELGRTVWVHGARRALTPDYEGEELSRYGLWAALGWPYEMGLFSARFVASGVLDRYPGLRVFLHHSGGMTPTFSRRVNGAWLELQTPAPDDEAAYARLQRPVTDYFKDFYADTSGQTPIAIKAALEFFGVEHVLLGSDFPFGNLKSHVAMLAQLALNDQEHTLLLGGNARRVLAL